MSLRSFVISVFLALLLQPVLVFADSTPGPAIESDPVDLSEQTLEQRLSNLQTILRDKEKEKKLLERELKQETDQVTINQLKQELAAAEDITLGVREEIVNLATGGVKLFEEPPTVEQEFNWRDDLELIFQPLLSQLREISDRPRQIDELEANIEYWRLRAKELDRVIENIQQNIDQINSNALKADLNELLDTAKSRHNSAVQKLSLLRNELDVLKESESPVWIALGNIFTGIALAMIFHFILAVSAAFIMYQLIRILSLIPIKLLHQRENGRNAFAERAVNLVRVVIGVVLGVLVYLVVLYTVAEWLLLLISLLVLAGLMLGLKEAIPKYLVEAKTLLNLGSIRQGERLMFNDLPWRISSLNVHTHLHNPALHGHFRVPLTEIVNLSSRPFHQDEPWFPTKVGDIVFLKDDTIGKVVRQTPEMVQLEFGASVYSYKTTDFLAQIPRNLSGGFTIYEVFGLDYQHQSDITSSILDTYREQLTATIRQSSYGEHSTYLQIEFDSAAASSLNFKILASFSGAVAEDYFKIKRLLQTASVNIANQQGWIIPFEQVTVHYQPAPVET